MKGWIYELLNWWIDELINVELMNWWIYKGWIDELLNWWIDKWWIRHNGINQTNMIYSHGSICLPTDIYIIIYLVDMKIYLIKGI